MVINSPVSMFIAKKKTHKEKILQRPLHNLATEQGAGRYKVTTPGRPLKKYLNSQYVFIVMHQ